MIYDFHMFGFFMSPDDNKFRQYKKCLVLLRKYSNLKKTIRAKKKCIHSKSLLCVFNSTCTGLAARDISDWAVDYSTPLAGNQ